MAHPHQSKGYPIFLGTLQLLPTICTELFPHCRPTHSPHSQKHPLHLGYQNPRSLPRTKGSHERIASLGYPKLQPRSSLRNHHRRIKLCYRRSPHARSRLRSPTYRVYLQKTQRQRAELPHPRKGAIGHLARSENVEGIFVRESFQDLDRPRYLEILPNSTQIISQASPMVRIPRRIQPRDQVSTG